MHAYLYYPDNEHDYNITFTIPLKINSVIVHVFKTRHIVATADNDEDTTRLVSGYENGRPINMLIESIRPEQLKTINKNNYVISCIRAPCLYRNLFQYNKYTTPLGFTVVRTSSELQVWHILSVQKKIEAKSSRKITGLRIHTDCGADRCYPKELIIISKNVSLSFINHLQQCYAHHKDVDVFKYVFADLIISDAALELESSQQ